MKISFPANWLLTIFSLVLAVSISACHCCDDYEPTPACDSLLIVEYPHPDEDPFLFLYTDENGTGLVTLNFNKPVDPATFILGETFVFQSAGSDIEGTLSFRSGNMVVEFTSSSSSGDFCSFEPDCFITLSLIGSGPQVIKDADGCRLDGDYDGIEGGNYNY